MVRSEPVNPGAAPKIPRPVTLRESVFEAILELIISGGLGPGQHLAENELAEMLGVSRQPVREALQMLSGEGWVDLRPGHGAFVHAPTVEEADQLLAVRTLLETESARLAALDPTAGGTARLREICARGRAAIEADDIDAAVAANSELHALITELSGNKVLAELASQVARRVRWYHTPVARHRGHASWEEHALLIDAIEAGDQERAEQIMRDHTEHTRQSYMEQRAQSPDEPAPAPQRRRRPRSLSAS
ncbi:GntR family transcriptional regulator [Planomonospora venezuelensis]|uniref:DNA-binding GntR family transcriptional regulator n=1 Tax=Planomonospora venezuelensis TaxID=1999 RepID=A0A841D7Y0_PLAVE|nr:GntR family transcriptional regulator [Planomonospora venezuelensis]MBB5964438.1 DNA-binding GntR family transcriptional regulator [Planomonospora venezuelensis]GIN04173.1 transcriptional regulator [Planomonospora venezuelensis]